MAARDAAGSKEIKNFTSRVHGRVLRETLLKLRFEDPDKWTERWAYHRDRLMDEGLEKGKLQSAIRIAIANDYRADDPERWVSLRHEIGERIKEEMGWHDHRSETNKARSK